MEQIRIVIGRDKSTPISTVEDFSSSCPSLTKKQRLYGFVTCFCLGFLISFISTFSLVTGNGGGAKFGVLYSIGNLVALCGSGFVVGPCQQVKLMMKPIRRAAAIIYLTMIVVVLAVAIALPDLSGLVLLLVITQFLAAIWYSASYVPFGRKIISGMCQKLCGVSLSG